MTAIVKAHKSASQEEQMSTIVGVLICILKLSSIDITKLQLEVGNLSTTRISSAVAQVKLSLLVHITSGHSFECSLPLC